MKDWISILNLAFHSRQFKYSITKHLSISIEETQRRTLLNTANKLYKKEKRIQWKIVDPGHKFFTDGELVFSIAQVLNNLPFEHSQYFHLQLVTTARGIGISY